jgi:hypothetical protein
MQFSSWHKNNVFSLGFGAFGYHFLGAWPSFFLNKIKKLGHQAVRSTTQLGIWHLLAPAGSSFLSQPGCHICSVPRCAVHAAILSAFYSPLNTLQKGWKGPPLGGLPPIVPMKWVQ